MKTLLHIAFVMLAASAFGAGWNTNAWPSYDYQRKGKIQMGDVYSGIVERCTATGTANPSAPTWYRSQRSDLINFKAKIKALIPLFARTNEAVAGSFDAWFDERTTYTNFPSFSTRGTSYIHRLTFPNDVPGFLAMVGSPTNYLDNTPRRCLNGLGPFTNDATVGHGHGWTNSYTAAGGSDFPGSRTNWYTTDYGRAPMPNIINAMVWSTKTNQETFVSWDWGNSACYHLTNIAASHATNVYNWSITNEGCALDDKPTYLGYTYTWEAQADYNPTNGGAQTNWAFGGGRTIAYGKITTIPTNYEHAVACYRAFSMNGQLIDGGTNNERATDAEWQGVNKDGYLDTINGSERNEYNLWETWAASAGSSYTNSSANTSPIDAPYTNRNPIQMRWPTPPAESVFLSTNSHDYYMRIDSEIRGETADGLWFQPHSFNDGTVLWLIKWDVTNGFDYK